MNVIYTATDIEKYLAGKMTAEEMHALEKAAMDDPFLAEALEGYAAAEPASISRNIELIQKELNERINTGKVIAMPERKSFTFQWMRAAAMILLVAGLGWMLYQSAFNKPPEEVASIKNKSAALPAPSDSNQFRETSPVAPTNDMASNQQKQVVNNRKKVETTTADDTLTDSGSSGHKMEDEVASIAKPIISLPINEEKISVPAGVAKEVGRNENAEVSLQKAKKNEEKDMITDGYNNATAMRRQSESREKTNFFRGQVFDANNNPIPFANITNTRDKLDTYTDAKGNFTLISPDSVLNVQVRSLGFENNIAQLLNDSAKNQVVLKPDMQNLNEVVISNKKANTNRSGKSKLALEDPEPADGWYNYDIYIANNLRTPDNVKAKPASGEVEVSFDVNKNGEPIDIRVDKSLCAACDEEAVRLVKEGPKWKRKNKKYRARVAVPF